MKDRIIGGSLFLITIVIVISLADVLGIGVHYYDGIRPGKLFLQMDCLSWVLPIAFVSIIFWLLRQDLSVGNVRRIFSFLFAAIALVGGIEGCLGELQFNIYPNRNDNKKEI